MLEPSTGSPVIVAAHPDDETLGAGGLLAKLWANPGRARVIIVVNNGGPRMEIAWRDLGVATKILGGCHVPQPPIGDSNYSDQRLSDLDVPEIASALRPLLRSASLVITHEAGDLNCDHLVVSRAVSVALRQTGASLLHMEIPGSHDPAAEPFSPNWYVQLSNAQMEAKAAAMEAYTMERRDWPHPRSPQALRALARVRGSAVGVPFAEAFRLVRHVESSGFAEGGIAYGPTAGHWELLHGTEMVTPA
jgi:LmbE family N-acetylglucosaminyl deacetylase